MRALVFLAGLAVCAAACTGDGGSPEPTPPPNTVSPPAALPDVAAFYVDRVAAPGGLRRGGRAVVAVPGEAGVLDPFAVGGDTPAARDLAPLWLPGLYRRAPDGRRSPWLASGKPVVSRDGLRITIDLRADARWSDGTPITSADVAATWRRASSRPGPWRAAYDDLAGVETPTPARIVLVQRQRGPAWSRLFVAPTGVLPATQLARLGARAYDLAVTGGPYRLGSRTGGLGTTWRRTPHPWPGSDPLLDEVVVQVVPDFGTAAELLAAGRVDVVSPYDAVRAAERLRAAGADDVQVATSAASPLVLTFTTDRSLVRDVRVRQAIARALDRAAFDAALLRDGGDAVDDLVPPGVAGHRRPWARWRRDLARSKALLEAAGWRGAATGRPRTRKGVELTLVLAQPAPSDLGDTLVRGLQFQLRDVGVQLDIAGADADRAAELARTGQADLALVRWDTDVVSDVSRLLASGARAPAGAGWSRWRDATADQLLAAADTAPDLRALDTRLASALARAADQLPVLPLVAVHPVTAGRRVRVAAPVAGYGGPFVDVDRWARA